MLEDLRQSDDNLIPAFVECCVKFIEQEGLTEEGIYRVPGKKAQADLLIKKSREGNRGTI